MIALFRKELGELSGTFLLSAFAVLFVGWAHTTISLAHFGGLEVIRYLIEDVTVIGCLAAFAAGHSRFGPEYQQGTLGFLDALPTSRNRIFLVKLLTGWLPIAMLSMGVGLIKAWALTAHPLPNAISVIPVVMLLTLSVCALLTAHYATGLVLSWFGEVGWQAMLVTGMSLAAMTALLPWVGQYYPLFNGVFHVQFVGGWPRVPLAPLMMWMLWSGGAMAVAWGLFLGPGDRIAYGPWWVKGIAQVLVYTPPMLVLLLFVALSTLGLAISVPDMIQPTFRTETEHFRILATDRDRTSAETLIAQAESVRAKVKERFGVEGPARLDLELTGASEHLGGVFVDGKIQLRTKADAQTLAHELSHAWSHELGAPEKDPDAWRFFEEGLATATESVVGPPTSQAAVPYFGTPASDWRLAPSHGYRSRHFNPDADYAIGRLWAEALIEVGGLEAPPCVIQSAAANPRGSTDPIPWWYARLAACDVDLDALLESYEARLPEGPAPEMIGWYAAYAGGMHIIETTAAPNDARRVCFARSSERTERTMYVMAYPRSGEPCELSAGGLDTEQFEIAIGTTDGKGDRLGEWRTIRVP
ncbi:MAG: hypothetical protein KC912_16265 [Proteobacteria bacterium]|nr:hypothetical protein [Pseudomonadota bacterium]